MVSLNEHDAEIHNCNTLNKAITDERIDIVDRIKGLMAYAETPNEMTILVTAYEQMYKIKRMHSF